MDDSDSIQLRSGVIMRKSAFLQLIPVILLIGCSTSKNHVVTLNPAAPQEESGSILLHFTEPAQVTVAVDDDLVADGMKNTKTLEIDGIPPGTHDVRVMVGGKHDSLDERIEVDVRSGEQSSHVVKTPAVSTSWALWSGLLIGAALIGVLAS